MVVLAVQNGADEIPNPYWQHLKKGRLESSTKFERWGLDMMEPIIQ